MVHNEYNWKFASCDKLLELLAIANSLPPEHSGLDCLVECSYSVPSSMTALSDPAP
jgi:hypothetical protein